MLRRKRIVKIVDDLKKAKEVYYNSGESFLKDSEYDELENELSLIDPMNEELNLVGCLVSGKKAKHDIPMLSMNKGKTIGDIEDWILNSDFKSLRYIITPKLDGVSGSLKYKNGDIIRVSTRGDGEEGQDITHVSTYIKTIPSKIKDLEEKEIRGEFVILKNSKLNKGNAPLRNMCSGLLNRKEDLEDLKEISFIAYQGIGFNFNSEKSVLGELRKLGFQTVNYIIADGEYSIDIIDKYFELYKKELRELWPFETDGLVILVDDNKIHEEIDSKKVLNKYHHYNIALKPPPEGAETVVLNVLWQMSRQGNLIPVAEFEEIHVNGVNITKATLNNYENAMINLNVCIGDRLIVERANDVIPFVKENLDINNSKKSKKPRKCPFCRQRLKKRGVHISCVNPECPEVNVQKIIFWVKQSKIDGVSSSTIKTLFDNKIIDSIVGLYNIKKQDLLNIAGFQEKRVGKVIDEIKNSRKTTLPKFIAMLGVPLVQEKTVDKLKIKTIDDFLKFDKIDYVVSENIVKWLEDDKNVSMVKELVEILEFETKDKFNKTVCFTGKGPFSRSELKTEAEKLGFETLNSVTKELDCLVCDDIDSGSSKINKAKKMNINILSYNEFFKKDKFE